MGTAAYMSPEQARGKPVDRQTDIWAFGCCFYEALTAKKAFQGETVTDTLAAVVNKEPDWTTLPEELPQKVRGILLRCLRKDKRLRLRDMGDAWIELQDAPAPPPDGAAIRPPRTTRLIYPIVTFLSISVAIVAVVASLLNSPATNTQREGKYTIALPRDAPVLALTTTPSIAFSPDGTTLVYAADRGGTFQLYRRDMNQFEVVPIPRTENAHGPFFSPNGEWVGYFDFQDRRLKKVALSGGAPTVICDAQGLSVGGSWASDDMIVFSFVGTGVLRVSADGGTPELVASPDAERGENAYLLPQILPGGEAALFTIGTPGMTSYDDALIGLVSLDTGAVEILLEGGSNPRYVPSGYIVYGRADWLMGVPFDVTRLEITGPPFQIFEGVLTSENIGYAQFGFSRDGTLVYVPGTREAWYNRLVWVGRDGAVEPVPLAPRIFRRLRLSPDGTKLALQLGGGTDHLWIYELDRGTFTRFTFEWDNFSPVWEPDGGNLIYGTSGRGFRIFFRKSTAGGASEEELLQRQTSIYPDSCSPDGVWLAYTQSNPDTNMDIYLLPLRGGSTPQPFLQSRFDERQAAFSPSGGWIAYTSNESGEDQVYVQAFSSGSGKIQISTEGGTGPAWAHNERELYYRNGSKMMVTSVSTETSFRVGTPELLFEMEQSHFVAYPSRAYDLGRDGRFLMISRAQEW
jgi:serine/threonine-protein kinase